MQSKDGWGRRSAFARMDGRTFAWLALFLAIVASVPSLLIVTGGVSPGADPVPFARFAELRFLFLLGCVVVLAVALQHRVRFLVQGTALARAADRALEAVAAFSALTAQIRAGQSKPAVRPAYDEMKGSLEALLRDLRTSRLGLDRWTGAFASAVVLIGAAPDSLESSAPEQVAQGLEIVNAVVPDLQHRLAELRELLLS